MQGTSSLHFFYDAQNRPAVVVYNGTAYAYVKNLQGDIIAILDSTGAVVVSYTYDAWGTPTSIGGTLASTLGAVQPFRYRGYVYDEETGMYYLRSRYYSPNTVRFINVDAFCKGNTFSYCKNAPIANRDDDGSNGGHMIEKIIHAYLYDEKAWYDYGMNWDVRNFKKVKPFLNPDFTEARAQFHGFHDWYLLSFHVEFSTDMEVVLYLKDDAFQNTYCLRFKRFRKFRVEGSDTANYQDPNQLQIVSFEKKKEICMGVAFTSGLIIYVYGQRPVISLENADN